MEDRGYIKDWDNPGTTLGQPKKIGTTSIFSGTTLKMSCPRGCPRGCPSKKSVNKRIVVDIGTMGQPNSPIDINNRNRGYYTRIPAYYTSYAREVSGCPD